ncbi:hypothetical protein TWF281_007414 [Arthrobotrys megalospora]
MSLNIPPDTRVHSFTNNDYTVGWICALPVELAAATAMLDERHPDLPQDETDLNTYTLGQIRSHNVVLTCLPSGTMGTNPAAIAAGNLLRTFPKIRFGLMVGIGGGAPREPSTDPYEDIRLGDVVVSNPEGTNGGVIQYDFGKTIGEGRFIQIGSLDKPPAVLRSAVSKLRAQHECEGSRISQYVLGVLESKPRMKQKFQHQGPEHDELFQADYDHNGDGRDCENCDKGSLLAREPRDMRDPVIHYGLIGSANQVMRHGGTREKLRRERGILCFEMEAAGIMDNFPCLVIRGICDYSDTHKNKRWQPYAAITAAGYAKELLGIIPAAQVAVTKEASEIMKLVAAVGEQLGPILDDHKRRYHDDVLDWLTPMDYGLRQSDFINRHLKGTGQWLLSSKEFTRWLDQSKQTLFCPGMPGAGKTIITSMVVNHLQSKFRADTSVGIAYLYCSFQQQENQEPVDLLLSLLKQLIQEKKFIPGSIRDLYESHRGKRIRPSFEEASDALDAVLLNFSRCFIIVDALDECSVSDGKRTRFLSRIFKLQAKFAVNIFATSRFIPEIERQFEGSLTVEIRANPEDVWQYLEESMQQLPTFIFHNFDLQQEIKTTIVKAVDGIFLLAQLHLRSLIGKKSPKALKAALQRLPSGSEAYNDAYGAAMKRIESQVVDSRELAMQILSWITFTKRALTTSELRHALAVEINTSEFDEENLPDIDDMVSVCTGLVIIDKESDIIRLIHFTAQEYFKQTWATWFCSPNADIGRVCATYLSFKSFEAGFCATDVDFESRLETYPLYDYAARNWGYHACLGLIEDEPLVLELLRSERKPSASAQAMTASKLHVADADYSQRVPRQMTGVHVAAYFGMREATAILLENEYNPNVEDSYGRTPLSWAARNGHEMVVRLLLTKNGINGDAKDAEYGQTPLWLASENGHEAIVKLLFDSGGDLNSKDTFYGRTPLWCAAEGGHQAVVEFLLSQEGVDLNARVKDGRTPLSLAASRDYKEWATLYVDKGKYRYTRQSPRKPNTESSWTVLSSAAENGRDEMVKLLLTKSDLDLNTKVTKYGFTPLWCAAANGHEAVVKLLLAKEGIHLNTKDTEYERTPLSWAAHNGHAGVVKLLLAKNGVHLNSRDKWGSTPLQLAASSGHNAVVKLLISNGSVMLDFKDKSGYTPLSTAAKRGHEAAVLLLLDKGAEIESRSVSDETPLYRAADNGHEGVVKLLLEKGADPNSKSQYGWTPLYCAAMVGYEGVVKLLLEKGADPNSESLYGWTPLYSAAAGGYEGVVKLLLEKGVDPEYKNCACEGRTPLDLAVERGHEGVVKLLSGGNPMQILKTDI